MHESLPPVVHPNANAAMSFVSHEGLGPPCPSYMQCPAFGILFLQHDKYHADDTQRRTHDTELDKIR